jgi:hypothetical protein
VNAAFEKRLIGVWLALSAITILQLGVGAMDGEAALAPSSAIAASAIGIGLIKVRIVIREFMEVRHAPAWLGRLTDGWVAGTGAILLCAHLAGTAFAGR